MSKRERTQVGDEMAALVAQRCGYLPLALRIAGATLLARPYWSMRKLAGSLADEHTRLQELSKQGLGRQHLVPDAVKDDLPNPGQRLHRMRAQAGNAGYRALGDQRRTAEKRPAGPGRSAFGVIVGQSGHRRRPEPPARPSGAGVRGAGSRRRSDLR